MGRPAKEFLAFPKIAPLVSSLSLQLPLRLWEVELQFPDPTDIFHCDSHFLFSTFLSQTFHFPLPHITEGCQPVLFNDRASFLLASRKRFSSFVVDYTLALLSLSSVFLIQALQKA